MDALDRLHTAPPAAWTAEQVRSRLVEAFTTERKMPGQRFIKAGGSSWPATPLYSFVDVMHWNNPGDGAREREWQRWERAKGAFPVEVSRMEEAYEWLRWLPDGERRCLDTWAKCEAFARPVAREMRKLGFRKTTFYRKVNDGSLRIACRLNAQGVVVR